MNLNAGDGLMQPWRPAIYVIIGPCILLFYDLNIILGCVGI